MMTESGRVVALETDGVWVETRQQRTCQSCSARKGCGQGLIAQTLGQRRHHVRALLDPVREHPRNLAVGDWVEIGVPDDLILKGVLWVYMLPLIGMLAGALVGDGLWPGRDGWVVLAGGLGLGLGFAGVAWHARWHRDNPAYQPLVLRRLTLSDEAAESLAVDATAD